MTGQDDQTSTVTPLADAILQLRDRDILSMHALPWAQRRSVTGSSLEEAYDETIGRDFPNTDCVFAGGALDSFFRPEAALDLAQHCAAEAFGADYTFFISCGVALASKVALSTCCEPLSRVLLCDPGATVSPAWLPESVDVVRVPLSEPDGLPRTGDLLDLLGTAAGQGWPFTTLVMSAPGADLGYDYPRLLDECLRRSPDMTIIVDESPCGVHNFHSTLRPGTALGAAQMVSRQLGKEIRMMVVHAASQTMIAAGQGAYLHVFGPIDLIESVRRSLYSCIPVFLSHDVTELPDSRIA
ncbi:MAG: hypothetical protein JXA67_09900 [Micromonosporaceae bacterium]|nr:hypothetical protein [Micromonosporaceae bacterium]